MFVTLRMFGVRVGAVYIVQQNIQVSSSYIYHRPNLNRSYGEII